MDLFKKIYLILIKLKPRCFFKRITGFDCPGCGGSHAVWALLNGHPIKSFLYHPAVMTAVLIAIYCTVTSIFKKKSTVHVGHVYAVLFVILIQWGIKTILHIAGFDYIAYISSL